MNEPDLGTLRRMAQAVTDGVSGAEFERRFNLRIGNARTVAAKHGIEIPVGAYRGAGSVNTQRTRARKAAT